jgi:hypothetical protein
MARYDEARKDFTELANIMGGLAVNISREEMQLNKDIDHGAEASEDSERRRKDELMRAVDVCTASSSLSPISWTLIFYRLEDSSFDSPIVKLFLYHHQTCKWPLGQILIRKE